MRTKKLFLLWVMAIFLTGCSFSCRMMDSVLSKKKVKCKSEMDCLKFSSRGGFCSKGICVACRKNTDCKSGMICDLKTKSCRECMHDQDCKLNAAVMKVGKNQQSAPYCQLAAAGRSNVCTACNHDSHCPSGLECSSAGKCSKSRVVYLPITFLWVVGLIFAVFLFFPIIPLDALADYRAQESPKNFNNHWRVRLFIWVGLSVGGVGGILAPIYLGLNPSWSWGLAYIAGSFGAVLGLGGIISLWSESSGLSIGFLAAAFWMHFLSNHFSSLLPDPPTLVRAQILFLLACSMVIIGRSLFAPLRNSRDDKEEKAGVGKVIVSLMAGTFTVVKMVTLALEWWKPLQ